MAIYPKAFEIKNISKSDNGRFFLQIKYRYNYNLEDDNFTNEETYYFNIPIEELTLVCENDINTGLSSLEINGASQCLFRFTNSDFDYTQTWTDPLALYQYIISNIL